MVNNQDTHVYCGVDPEDEEGLSVGRINRGSEDPKNDETAGRKLESKQLNSQVA